MATRLLRSEPDGRSRDRRTVRRPTPAAGSDPRPPEAEPGLPAAVQRFGHLLRRGLVPVRGPGRAGQRPDAFTWAGGGPLRRTDGPVRPVHLRRGAAGR